MNNEYPCCPVVDDQTELKPQVFLTSNMVIQPQKFSGDTSDYESWLKRFNMSAQANDWDDTIKRKKIVGYLESSALKWYMSYQEKNASSNWIDFVKSMDAAFLQKRKEISFARLSERKFLENERLLDYIYDKKDLCLSYNPQMSDAEIVGHLINGLRGELKEAAYILEHDKLDAFVSKLRDINESKLANKNKNIRAIEVSSIQTRNKRWNRFGQERRFDKSTMNQVKFKVNNSSFRKPFNKNKPRVNFKTSENKYINKSNFKSYNNGSANTKPKTKSTACFNCNREGHFKKDCPDLKRKN